MRAIRFIASWYMSVMMNDWSTSMKESMHLEVDVGIK